MYYKNDCRSLKIFVLQKTNKRKEYRAIISFACYCIVQKLAKKPLSNHKNHKIINFFKTFFDYADRLRTCFLPLQQNFESGL